MGLERLVFFSDAVFAIAITLLALDIRLPSGGEILSDSELSAALFSLWPKYLGYVISFLTIGAFWGGHHRKFRFIRRYDRRLIALNLFMLMGVAFIPFPTAVLSEYGNRTATLFYAATMVAVSLLITAIWLYASAGNRLADEKLEPAKRRRETMISLFAPAVFLLSIGLAFVNADLAKYSWALILLAYLPTQ